MWAPSYVGSLSSYVDSLPSYVGSLSSYVDSLPSYLGKFSFCLVHNTLSSGGPYSSLIALSLTAPLH